MDRLVSFWCRYRPRPDPAAQDFLLRHGQCVSFATGQPIKLPDQSLPFLCIVLDGMVGGFVQGTDGDPSLRELILPMDYFSGPAHAFAQRNRQIEYRALTRSTLLRIGLPHARQGQQHHPDLSELFQVMKQRKINQLRQQVELYQERDHYRRYCLYRQLLPDWAYLLPRDLQCQFLQMSKTHFHRIKAIYLRNHLKT